MSAEHSSNIAGGCYTSRVSDVVIGSRRIADRCVIYGEIARGAHGGVYLGRLLGAEGFARIVAVKKLVDGAFDDASARAMLDRSP